MTRIVRKYWKWDECLNNTPYKLGLNIECLLQNGLVYPENDAVNSFLCHAQSAPRRIEVRNGKVILAWFSFASNSTFPEIKQGLWDMEEPAFIATLNDILGLPCTPQSGDYLFVVFRGGFVTAAAIFRKSPSTRDLGC
ncbi:MAG: hypothetical protein ACX93T_03275 [Bacteroidota bacterium]